MSESFEFVAEARAELGGAASRRLRRQDKIPAIIYGGSKEPTSIILEHKAVLKALTKEGITSHIFNMNVDGVSEQVIVKAIRRHCYKPAVLHMDFQRISATEKMSVSIPLHVMNEEKAPGVIAGGMVSHLITELDVKCLPKHLPEFIEVDLSTLELDQSIHLSDIKLSEGVELASGAVDAAHNQPVVSIHLPKKVAIEAEDAPVADVASSEEKTEE
jgi:large subunit ribosomal protein L25